MRINIIKNTLHFNPCILIILIHTDAYKYHQECPTFYHSKIQKQRREVRKELLYFYRHFGTNYMQQPAWIRRSLLNAIDAALQTLS